MRKPAFKCTPLYKMLATLGRILHSSSYCFEKSVGASSVRLTFLFTSCASF